VEQGGDEVPLVDGEDEADEVEEGGDAM